MNIISTYMIESGAGREKLLTSVFAGFTCRIIRQNIKVFFSVPCLIMPSQNRSLLAIGLLYWFHTDVSINYVIHFTYIRNCIE